MNGIDLVGMVLDGRYRVVSWLGAGAMATVYLAHQESLDRDVVVKVPDAALAADEEFLLRFRQEIRSLTKLRHPQIVSILEAGEVNGVPYAVMDYLEGGNLKERLSEMQDGGRSATPREALEWLAPIARALDFVHGKGVVHRDVKPANLLFDGEGNPFLSDFGIAKALGPMDSEITRTGSTVGTALYMAPEQGLDATITGAADQYALAVIAFEMLCGRPPHVGATSPVIMVKKLTEDSPEIGDLAPKLPENASAAVMRALERAPGNQFPSCSAFIDAFAAGLAGVAAGGDASAALIAEAVVEDDPGLTDATGTLFVPVATPLDESEEVAGPGELTGTYLASAAKAPATDPLPTTTEDASGASVAPIPPRPEDEPVASKRHRGILIAGVAAAIVAACLLIFTGGGGSGPETETPPPEIHLTVDRSPPDGVLLATPTVEVAGRVRGDAEAWVELAGERVDLDAGGSFTATADLKEGQNVFTLRVLRLGGEVVETRKYTVVVDTREPGIVLDTLPDGLLVRDPRLVVAGRVVDLHPGEVTVAGLAARLETDGAFRAEATLTEGRNELEVRARDEAGNDAVETLTVTLDSRAPVFSLDPLAGVTAASVIVVTGTIHEYGSWVSVNGIPAALVETRFFCSVPLAAGRNTIEVVVMDQAGNRATSRVSVMMDDQPPAVRLDPLPEITGEARIAVAGEVDHQDTRVTVNGVEVEVVGTRFACEVPLSSGENRVRAVAVNPAGLSTFEERTVVLDHEPPTVRLDELPESTDEARVRVTGEVGEEGCAVTVNGIEAVVEGTRYSCEVPLSEGENAIEIVATDRAGHRAAATAMIRRGGKPLVVQIDPQLERTVEQSITVTGFVDREGCTVTVNGVAARMGGTKFKCVVQLILGDNEIEATAVGPSGESASARVSVRRDAVPSRPPKVRIDPLRAPANSRRITISGSVDRDGCRVTVNGLQATVTGRKFTCMVPFTPELKEVVIIATDPSGRMGGARAAVKVQDR